MDMPRFSVSRLSFCVTIYHSTQEHARELMRYYDPIRDVLGYTVLENEVTFYLSMLPTNTATHEIFRMKCMSDGRRYHVFDIHEDQPGIDHVGIIHRISKRFVEHNIPILYVNTYGHNLVLVEEEHVSRVVELLSDIAYL